VLLNQHKIDIRRHLRVPFAAVPTSGYTLGIRTIHRSGQLELYMNLLQAEEEAVLTGFPYAIIRLAGTPTAGDTVTATINSTPVTYTVTSADQAATVPLQNVSINFAIAINNAGLGPFANGTNVTLPPLSGSVTPVQSQVTITQSTTFTITAGSTGGHTNVLLQSASTVFPYPQIPIQNFDGTSQTYYGYIQICNFLESAIAGASQNLSLLQAGGLGAQAAAAFRPYEIAQRIDLYNYYCTQMGNALSVGRDPAGRGGFGDSASFIV
jgi:hypothetical protein